MNERIEQLAKQAGINIVPRRPYIDDEPDGYLESDNDFVLNNYEVVVALLEGEALKKFAELIVKECTVVACPLYMKASKAEVRGMEQLLGKIYEHFGVEE